MTFCLKKLVDLLLFIFFRFMPKNTMLEAGKLFGMNQSMDTFQGRDKKDE